MVIVHRYAIRVGAIYRVRPAGQARGVWVYRVGSTMGNGFPILMLAFFRQRFKVTLSCAMTRLRSILTSVIGIGHHYAYT